VLLLFFFPIVVFIYSALELQECLINLLVTRYSLQLYIFGGESLPPPGWYNSFVHYWWNKQCLIISLLRSAVYSLTAIIQLIRISAVIFCPAEFLGKVDSMRWFSHRRGTGGRHNCITYLLTDVVAWLTATSATPTPVCWFFLRSDSANRQISGREDPGVRPMTPKFELGRYFCTVHVTAKFHHPTFNLSC